MSSPTEESSLKRNLITQSSSSYNNKSLDGDIIFVGDYIDLSKTSDAVVDLTEESSAKMNNLITQSSNDDDAKQNLVDGEGNHEIDTLDTLSSSNKRCCNDTECSNYRDIGESTYVYFRHLACLLISLPFSLIIWYIGDALMIGGGTGKKSRRSKYASSYDGKSPEEIRKVKKARKAALEKARRMKRSQQKADEEKEKDESLVVSVALQNVFFIMASK